MTTKIRSVLVLLGACLALAACGGDGDTASSGPDVQETAPPSATSPPGKSFEELPTETPEPGPPAMFRVVVTDDAVEPNVDSLPEGPSLQALVINTTDERIPFNFFVTKRAVVGSGQIEPGEQISVSMRNLLPGELFVTSPPGRRATIEITPK